MSSIANQTKATFSSLIKKYPLIVAGLIFLIFFTIILVISAFNIHDTVEVEILVAPASATVKIDDKNYDNGTFRIPVGEHSVYIEKEGFISQEFTINTMTTNKIYAYLKQSDDSLSWYYDHESDALLLTKIGDFLSDQEAKKFNALHSIIEHLPIVYANYDDQYNYTEYRIDGGQFKGCETSFCLKVTDTTGNNLEAAKQKIKDLGFNPDNFQILYEYTPIKELN